MGCVICHNGDTELGTTTVTLERGGLTFVVKDVPAMVCSNCGEAYLDAIAAERVLRMAEEASESGVVVDIRAYKAA